MTFYQVVEEVKKLSKNEKEEKKELLENYLVKEARKEFKANFEESLKLEKDERQHILNDSDDFYRELN